MSVEEASRRLNETCDRVWAEFQAIPRKPFIPEVETAQEAIHA